MAQLIGHQEVSLQLRIELTLRGPIQRVGEIVCKSLADVQVMSFMCFRAKSHISCPISCGSSMTDITGVGLL